MQLGLISIDLSLLVLDHFIGIFILDFFISQKWNVCWSKKVNFALEFDGFHHFAIAVDICVYLRRCFLLLLSSALHLLTLYIDDIHLPSILFSCRSLSLIGTTLNSNPYFSSVLINHFSYWISLLVNILN